MNAWLPALPSTLITNKPVATAFAIYAISFAILGQFALKRYGAANSGGSPRWRNALGLLPQVIVLPSLVFASLFVPSWAAVFERTFVYVFASLLIFDFFTLELNSTMVAHHAVCLGGHAFAFCSAPEAFWYYFAAVAALEAGSGTCCFWWLVGDIYPTKPHEFCDMLYKAGMSFSNAVCVYCLLAWSTTATSLGLLGRCVPIFITAGLIYGRQAEMMNVMKNGRGAATTG